MVPKLTDMSTWNGRTGQDGLRSFTDEEGNFWLEQNSSKTSKWAKFAKKGHNVAWKFGANRRYTGRMLVDGVILTPSEAMIGALAIIENPSKFESLTMIGPSPCYINDGEYVGGFERADIEALLESLESNQIAWSASMAPAIMGEENRFRVVPST